MAERILLIDSDIFILLAGAGLLDKAVQSLGFTLEDVRRLDALPYQLAKSRKIRQKYPGPVLEKASEWCKKVKPFTQRPADDELLGRIARVPRIDPGEAVMLGLLAEQEVFLLASGDKAFMRALAQTSELAALKKTVSGRVICLETILWVLLGEYDPRMVARSFAVLRDANTTLCVVFSQGEETPLESALQAIESYFNDLRKDVGEDFLFNP